MAQLSIILDLVFAWSFSVALILAAVDWVRPLSVAPYFNVGWLIGIAGVALVGRVWVGIRSNPSAPLIVRGESEEGEEIIEGHRPPWILFVACFVFAAVAAKSLGWIAAIALGLLATLVVWILTMEEV